MLKLKLFNHGRGQSIVPPFYPHGPHSLFLATHMEPPGRRYKTSPKWGIKPPPTPVLATFDPWGGLLPPGCGFIPLLGGVGLSPHRGGFIHAKGCFYPPIGSFFWGGLLPIWGGFVPPFP